MEELIPLIALYVPGMLPSTTIFASQLKRIEGKAQEKQAMFAARRTVFDRIVQAGQLVENGGRGKVVGLGQLRALGEDGTKVICGMLRLAAWGPAPMQLWRIDRHLKHIAKDDELLTNEDLGRRLRDEEIAKALDERGMWVLFLIRFISMLTRFLCVESQPNSVTNKHVYNSIRGLRTCLSDQTTPMQSLEGSMP